MNFPILSISCKPQQRSILFQQTILDAHDVNEMKYRKAYEAITVKVKQLCPFPQDLSKFLTSAAVDDIENVVFGEYIISK